MADSNDFPFNYDPMNGDNANDWAFFSIDPDAWTFPSQRKPEWISNSLDSPEENAEPSLLPSQLQKVNPNLLRWFLLMSDMVQSTLYTPIRTGRGRLSDVFSAFTEMAASLADDLAENRATEHDKTAFQSFCQDIGEGLTDEANQGLWLTDSEESMVKSMCNRRFMYEYGG